MFNLFLILFIFLSMFYFLVLFLFYLFLHFLHHLNLIRCLKPEIFKRIHNKFKSCHFIWFCTLLLHFGTCAYLFSPNKGSCYAFSTRNKFLATYGVVFQNDIQLWEPFILYFHAGFHFPDY